MRRELKPIRSEVDYEAALAEVERLWGAKGGTPDGDRLDVLVALIDAYEAEHYPTDPPDPIEAIKFCMEQGLTRKDLEPIIGTRTRVAEVLNRKRGLSIDMIRRLHKRLGISADVLIRPSRIDKAALSLARGSGYRCRSARQQCVCADGQRGRLSSATPSVKTKGAQARLRLRFANSALPLGRRNDKWMTTLRFSAVPVAQQDRAQDS